MHTSIHPSASTLQAVLRIAMGAELLLQMDAGTYDAAAEVRLQLVCSESCSVPDLDPSTNPPPHQRCPPLSKST